MNIQMRIDSITAPIADLITIPEMTRFRSSLLIDLTEGTRTETQATGRAFRSLWSHRLGYSSRLSGESLETLTKVANRLGDIDF